MSLFYWRVKDFVVDVISTFFKFIYEFLLMVTHIIVEVYYMLRKVILELIVPNIIDLCCDINKLIYIAFGGLCWTLSGLSLTISKQLAKLSEKLLAKSEQVTHKTWET